jgi:hypothetical protein
MRAIETPAANDRAGNGCRNWVAICGCATSGRDGQTDYAALQLNICQRAKNRLASTLVTSRR